MIRRRLMLVRGFTLERRIAAGKPWHQPQKREAAKREEHRAPAIANEDHCSDQRTNRWPHRMPDAHRAVATAPLMLGRVLGENASIGGEDYALGQPKQHP